MGWPLIMQACLSLFFILRATAAIPAAPQPREGCPVECGKVTNITFPFGIGDGCYLEGFELYCNTTTNPPKLFMGNGTGGDHQIEVLEIISNQGQILINKRIAKNCYNESGMYSTLYLRGLPYKLSNTRNGFVAIGCDTYGSIIDNEPGEAIRFQIGCQSICDTLEYVQNTSCSGVGCCQVNIPKGIRGFNLHARSFSNHSRCLKFSPCSYAFLIDRDSFNFDISNFTSLKNVTRLPVTLDWSIGNKTCPEAQKSEGFACVANNSYCSSAADASGYLCNCSSGYEGNPYLINGCRDINECNAKTNPCVKHAQCKNVLGDYTCYCDSNMEGDGRSDGNGCNCTLGTQLTNSGCICTLGMQMTASGCSCKPGMRMTDSGCSCKPGMLCLAKHPLYAVVIGTSLSLVFLCATIFWSYWALKERKLIKLKEKFFEQNGGFLLQRQISEDDGSTTGLKIFSSRELNEATDNFAENRILGKGGFGTVYKGILPDGRIIAVKKSKITDEEQKEQFINEVVILSHIKHKNVVKLLGCCLETSVPMLIYECISNGTLSEHIHDDIYKGSLSLERRMRIAVEVADALAYLHSSTSTPIIHRDVKCSNILLDDKFTSKVSDFGMSRLVPFNQDRLNSLVRGTFGYLDPEYMQSGLFTDKSDVYSFGVVLVELLTGEKSVLSNNRSLANYFITYYKQNQLQEILEDRVRDEGHKDLLLGIAEVAKRCLCVKREERPTMKEVSKDLEELILSNHPWAKKSDEEIESILMKPSQYVPEIFGASGNFSEAESSVHPMLTFNMMR